MATPNVTAKIAALKRLSTYAKACGLQHGATRLPGEPSLAQGADIVREADEAVYDFEFFFGDDLPPQPEVQIAIAPEDRL